MERITVDQQDAINTLATASWFRNREQFEFAAFIRAAEAQGGVTAERVEPFIQALNLATKLLWSAWWKAYNLGMGKRPTPGTAPQVKFDLKLRCDLRCQNATGYDCVCGCGGANHGLLAHLGLVKVKDPAWLVGLKKQEAKEEMKDINSNPVANLLIQSTRKVR